MRVVCFLLLLLICQSCATKKYTQVRLLPHGINSLTEETYTVTGNQKKLLHRKEITFTKGGRIKQSKTFDPSGKLLKKSEKKLWFTEETFPDKEPYYCKTRWKPRQRERISCYTKKRYKQNESIYHYNKDGTIKKIVDNFTTFHTQHFYYNNNKLSKIVTTAKNGEVIDEILISCADKDAKGTCLKEVRTSAKTGKREEILVFPNYD